MKKYPKVHRLGHNDNSGILSGNGPLYIKEKLDGANCRFSVNPSNDGLLFGSRNVEWKNNRDLSSSSLLSEDDTRPSESTVDSDENIDKNFNHAVEYVRDRVGVSDIEDLGLAHDPEKLVFFGEAMHPHTLEYADTSGTEIGWKGVPSFIGFDIYCGDHDGFLTTEVCQRFYEKLGLPFVNIVDTCEPSLFMDEYGDDFVPQSAYYDGPAEGVVLSNTSNGLRAKLVSEQFAEKHGTSKSGVDKNGIGEYDTHEVVQTYCTDARIRKHVHKLQDDGHTLGRPMMSELPVRVARDIVEEEAHEFVTSNWVIDFNEFRSSIAQSSMLQADCLSVIDQMQLENATEDNGGEATA